MTLFEIISLGTSFFQSLSTFSARAESLLKTQGKLMSRLWPAASYENLLLDITFDIHDPRGRRATISRTQRLRFLVNDGGIIRDLVWGDGQPLADYSVEGAKYLGIQAEGGKQAVLLGLPQSPMKGECVTIRTRRVVRNVVPKSEGYAEVLVERPTARLVVTVRFPRTRPPQEARLVTSPPGPSSRKLPCRYAAGGRPYLRWSLHHPEKWMVYSIRWLW